jgi:serine/threonine protein phosphatase PrpC
LLVLTTDGVHGSLDAERIERLLVDTEDTAAIATTLITTALAHDGRDNCTAVVVECVCDW